MLPCILYPIATFFLIKELRKAEVQRQKLSSTSSSSNSNNSKNPTNLVLALTLTFFIAELPLGILLLLNPNVFVSAFYEPGPFTLITAFENFFSFLLSATTATHMIICLFMSSQYRTAAISVIRFDYPIKNHHFVHMKLLVHQQNSDKIIENVFIEPQIVIIPLEESLSSRRFQIMKRRKFFLIIIIILFIFMFYNAYKILNSSIDYEFTESDSENSNEEELDFGQPPLKPGLLIDPTRRLTRILPVSHVFINSAYFYPTSKSLGSNAIALAMVVDSINFNVENATYNVVGTNGTHTKLSTASSQTEGVPTCRYTPVMATTTTIENLTKLEMESNGVKVEIPFKVARYTAPKPVIICISPQFVAEQWQIFMMHVHVANQFGGHLHIYLTSIIESFFELMKEYERQGYLTLDYWLRMKFENTRTPYFEPNENIEWRNQAGAQTDCLLQYKEAAEYIAFFDMDDILFPKNYPTYFEEFNAEWALQPEATSVFYGRREHEFIKGSLDQLNFRDLVSSLRSSPTVKRGKVVVKPERYNSTWIHYSNNEDERTRRSIDNPTLIHVQRPLQKRGNNNITNVWKMDFGPLNETIRISDINEIENDIERIRNSRTVQAIAGKLPTSDFYLPIVFKCYYDAFYDDAFDHRRAKHGCPNADTCVLPQREEFKCVHSHAKYYSSPHMEPFTLHFTNDSFWSWDIGCYQ
uniref:G_PROTEIN_RECEP_F1_2 domain-containing protein n=1 Tax=Caenorhabditis tropicalis TaxID=1561998 RepID=A0A1I7V028_9PELO